ncbi:S1 RNA-binding domain-containing protein [Candidatus Woesearchaeota archaeon]|nr:S1 RNA-binding domain-containing protein [Candidatus Woesearchaeota archaeon]
MFYKKETYPRISELVICTVKKILPTSIFCDLDEYLKKEGLIHISEIAPGRIRNIRDYVVENKKIVCKVIGVDESKGHIDISLRRVNESERLGKLNDRKQEEKAEKLLEQVAKKTSISLEEIYQKAGKRIIEEFSLLNTCYKKLVSGDEKLLTNLGIDKKIASELTKIVLNRRKLKSSQN